MTKLAIALLAISLSAAGCSKTNNQTTSDTTSGKSADTAVQSKQGNGVGLVKGIDTAMHTVTLAHNDIPGIMEAMTMEYTLKEPSLANGIAAGDSVKFMLTEPATGTFVVTSIEKLH